eukprot:Skav213135  [mRNA]  locus=scaffold107:365739:369066:+ [translate_table: standard]
MVRGARKAVAVGVAVAVACSVQQHLNFVPGPRHAAPVAAAAASMMMAPAAFADEIGDAAKKLGDASYSFAKEAELWNDTCSASREPWKRLHLGCSILAVNGISGNTKRMQQELETAQEVDLLLCNPPSLTSFRAVMKACEGSSLPIAFWQLDPTVAATETPPSISVIITTSPVPSNPSTDLLERVLLSLHLIPGLANAAKIIVCDGYKIAAGKSNPKAGNTVN